MSKLSHLDELRGVHMVDISSKPSSVRHAMAECVVELGVDAYEALTEERVAKGNVLTTAQLAGIMGAKQTSKLIPLCHSIPLDSVDLTFSFDDHASSVRVQASVASCGRTGVEMEALTAVSIASLSIYDMCKSISKEIRITGIHLVSKTGGVHAPYSRHNS